jgi:hypothetical protein
MRRLTPIAILLFFACAGSSLVAGVGPHDAARAKSLVADDPVELVADLGHRSFAVRRTATARLIELGVVAMDALQRGVQSEDREISFRSRHVLAIVRQNDFQRRLRAFASGRELGEQYHLPGWPLFAKQVGTSREARALFVEMQQAEPELLAALEVAPEEIGETLTERIAILQHARAASQQSNQPSLGTIASILFVLNCHDVDLPLVLVQSIGSYFRYDSFDTAIQTGANRDLLRKMLGTWIERSDGWDAYHAMYLSMKYNIPAGLAPAQRILKGEVERTNESYFVAIALHTVARFGDRSHIELVETALDNNTPFGGTIGVAGKAKYRTQIRDIALATAVHLAKLDHQEFGFERFRSHSSQVFHTNSAAFENDEKREQAMKKWIEYRRGQAAVAKIN